MRVIRYQDGRGGLGFARQSPDDPEVLEGLDGDPVRAAAKPTGERVEPARVLPPVDPANIFCIGLNYCRHARESGAEVGEHPVVFMKPTTAVTGPHDPIRVPAAQFRGDELDYEAELAVVLGRPGRDIPKPEALEHVAGYTVANDVSARRWQKHGGGGQWIRGKSFDTLCPLGPALVTPEEIPDPQNLPIRSRLNGELRQESTTADMMFSVAELIAFLSRDTTLLPGTVILTGTPEGVGFARQPPEFLTPGDRVSCEIAGIGALDNPVIGPHA